MKSLDYRVTRSFPKLMILGLIGGFTLPIFADGEGVPAEVLDLLPAPEKITQQDGEIFGKGIGSDFR